MAGSKSLTRRLLGPGARTARRRQLATEFTAHWPADLAPDVRASVEEVLGDNDRRTPTWTELFTAEARLIRFLPIDVVRLKLANLRDEYGAVVGASLAAGFLARLSDPKTTPDAQLRSEASDLLAQIQRLRVLPRGFVRLRVYVTALALLLALFFCAWIASSFIELTAQPQTKVPFATWMLVMAGMLGGCISALARLYSVPWTADLAVGVDRLSFVFWQLMLTFGLAVLEGGIFAVVLYLAFMGDVVTGDLFPRFQPSGNFNHFHDFFEKGPASHLDYAKAVLWAFIAGFSERLVPDFLDTLKPRLKLRAA